jgi:hypothetical protein
MSRSPAPSSAAGGEVQYELRPEFISWLASLDLGSDLAKVQEVFASEGILSKDKLKLAVQNQWITAEHLQSSGVRRVPALTILSSLVDK